MRRRASHERPRIRTARPRGHLRREGQADIAAGAQRDARPANAPGSPGRSRSTRSTRSSAATLEGLRGAAGHVGLRGRRATAAVRARQSRINTPMRLIEDLTWQATRPTTRAHAFKGDHCRAIAHVIRQLCGVSRNDRRAGDDGIVGTFLRRRASVRGSRLRHARAALRGRTALRRDVDESTGRPSARRATSSTPTLASS